MRLYLAAVICSVGTLAASPSFSQQVKIDVKYERVAITTVLGDLQARMGYHFVYLRDVLPESLVITVNRHNATLEQILDEVLVNNGLRYKIDEEIVVITRAEQTAVQAEKVITGRVEDEKGMGLPGVSIVVKGSSTGVISDVNGNFKLRISRTDAFTLVFSFVGMETREIVVRDTQFLKVVLKEKIKEIEEVVVTGYERIDKDRFSGSFERTSAEDLVFDASNTLEQALQGKIAGMVVTNESGTLGVRQSVRVRGTSTILGERSPLWVVDGVAQDDPLPFDGRELNNFDAGNLDMIRTYVGNAISWLNPEMIDDITVLKDASATAIYGVRAANGVIVITTKRGMVGKPRVSYTGDFMISSKLTYKKMNLMNSKERIDVSREIYEKGLLSVSPGKAPIGYSEAYWDYMTNKIPFQEFDARVKEMEVVNTDWFDLFFRNPFSNKHTLSVSGGSQDMTYSGSIGTGQSSGTAKGNEVKNYTANINISTKLWDKLFLDMSVAGSVAETKGYNNFSPYSFATSMTRVIPAYNADGSPYFYPKELSNYYQYSPVYELEHSGNKNTTSFANTRLNLRYEIFKGLRFESTLGYNFSNVAGESYMDEFTNSITQIRGYEYGTYIPSDDMYKRSRLPHGGEYNYDHTKTMGYTFSNKLHYNVSIQHKHTFNVMVGYEVRSTRTDGVKGTEYGYLPGRGKAFSLPPTMILTIAGTNTGNMYAASTPTITDIKNNYLSWFGSAYYSFQDKCVLTTSLRLDASNRFGQNEKYNPVWSIGFVWNAHKYEWFHEQNILTSFRLKGSYGFQGNVVTNVGPQLVARQVVSGTGGATDASTGEYQLAIVSLPNRNLRWEKTKTMNFGIDFGFFDNRINGTFQYYYKRGIDILRIQDIPFEFGLKSMPVNGGEVENKGWELMLSATPVRTKDFTWSVSVNTAKNYNNLKNRMGEAKSYLNAVAGKINKEGYPVGAFWAFRFVEVDPETGMPVFDLTGEDSVEATEDATVYMNYMGKRDPDIAGGLNTSIRYKNFSVSAGFNFQIGGKSFLSPLYTTEMMNSMPYEYSNLSKDFTRRWRKPGDITDVPALFKSGNLSVAGQTTYLTRMYNYADNRVVSRSYLKCNSISISYNLPAKLIKGFARSVSCGLSISNPFRIVSSDFKGRDPEVAMGGQPMSNSYNFKLAVTF